jgi:hypothetical protein
MTEHSTAAKGELVEIESAAAPAVTPMQMLQIAVEKGTDIEQLDKLMNLHERWEAREARKAFVQALAAFKADPPRIVKNRHVKFGNTEYDHATLDQVCEVIGQALAAHGLSHTWEINQLENAAVAVTCVLTHTLGHAERVTMRGMPDDSGSKNLIQQIGSTTTYLQRYTLLAATGLAAGEDNDGGLPGEPISAQQKEALVDMMKKTGADTARFLKLLGVASLDELPASAFGAAKVALQAKQTAESEKHENP